MTAASTIEYSLTDADFRAFVSYVLVTHRAAYIRNIAFVGLGTFVSIWLFIMRNPHDRQGAVLQSALMAFAAMILLHIYSRSQARRQVALFLKDPVALQARTVTVSPEGFRERTATDESFHTWSAFQSIGVTTGHIFLHVNPLVAFIVPRSHLPSDALTLMMAATPSDRRPRTGA